MHTSPTYIIVRVNPTLLSMNKLMSDDSTCRALLKINNVQVVSEACEVAHEYHIINLK